MSNFALPPPPPDYPIRMNHFELPPPPLDYPMPPAIPAEFRGTTPVKPAAPVAPVIGPLVASSGLGLAAQKMKCSVYSSFGISSADCAQLQEAINPGSTATATATDACGGTFGVLSPACFGVWLSSHATDALVITIGIVLLIAGMFALVHGKQILETAATAAA
jgi:hypothetical protein